MDGRRCGPVIPLTWPAAARTCAGSVIATSCRNVGLGDARLRAAAQSSASRTDHRFLRLQRVFEPAYSRRGSGVVLGRRPHDQLPCRRQGTSAGRRSRPRLERGGPFLPLPPRIGHAAARRWPTPNRMTPTTWAKNTNWPAPTTPFVGPGSHDLSFANVDDRLCLWIDGRLVQFTESTDYTPYGGVLIQSPWDEDLIPAGVAARGADVTVSHLVITARHLLPQRFSRSGSRIGDSEPSRDDDRFSGRAGIRRAVRHPGVESRQSAGMVSRVRAESRFAE